MKPAKYFTIAIVFILVNIAAISQNAWILKSEKDGVKVYTKSCDDSPIKSIKAECIVNASITALMAVLLDVDNSKDWIYATKKVSILKHVSPTELIYYSEVGLPWPICNRDFIADFFITVDSITNVVTATCINRPDYLPSYKGIVRVEHSWSQWVISPLAGGNVHIVYELQVDPGGNIPAWLTNLFATTGPFCTFQNLREQVKKAEYKNASLAFLKK